MKHLLTWLLACSLAATNLQAAVPILDPRITGTNSQVASGTFTVKSGATLATEAGALFSFSQPLSLGAGGLGVSLTDPNADRLTFWDDSAGSIAWLGLGTGLSISGTTLSVDSTLFAPSTATYIVQTANGTLTNEQALGALATGLLKNTTTTGVLSIAAAGTDFVGPGAVTTSGLTMATARLLGRSTASSGAIEEITVGSGLTLSSGTLSASGGGDVVGPASATDNALVRFDSTTGKLVQNSNVTLDDTGLLGLPAGVRQTFAPNATNAGLNVGSVAGDPSAPSNGDLWYDSTANELTARINGSNVALGAGGGGGGAPTDATYIVQTANGTLTNEQALGALATGLVKNTTTTGVLSIAAAGTDFVGPGAVTTSGLTMATARLLGRSTASTGAIEEITVGSGLTLSSGTLSASGGGAGGIDAITSSPTTVTKAFSTEGDTNGVFYFLGTNLGEDAWSNPQTSAQITAVRSTNGAGTVTDIFDRTTNATYSSGSALNDFIFVDLGASRSLLPNYYTLRNYNSGNRELRTWKLQGTNSVAGTSVAQINAATWTDLDVRSGDTTMLGANDWAQYTPNQSNSTAFRYLRILQTGNDATGGPYICVAEWELYGDFTYTPAAAVDGRLIQLNSTAGDSVRQTAWSATGGQLSAAKNIELVSTLTNGNVTISPNGTGYVSLTGKVLLPTQTPASATAAGVAGQIAWDANYIYVCTATNTWKRVAIATW